MWPKALAQLIELAPHITRLLPLADRFFQSKSAEAEASRTAMEQMADGLRGDLGQVTASHAGLYRQLNDQSEKLSTLSADLRSVKASVESVEAQLNLIEKRLTALKGGLIIVLLLLSTISLLLVILFLRPR
jgi:septal ring factor EnvC (AmiA/AmiB activator)